MKILLLVPHYAPDLGPSAPLFSMLSAELVKRGHQVVVLTTVPHYPTGQVQEPFRGRFIQKSVENGALVIRIRIPSLNRSNLAGRLVQFACYQLGATWAGLFEPYDAVFVANPALWVWLPFVFLVKFRRKPSIFSIYDVFPDVGIQIGVFRHPMVIRLVEALEGTCLMHSSAVRIISDSFRPAMNRLGVPDEKIALIYDWVDTDLIRPLPKGSPFSRENRLDKKFVVLYAGNIGLSQGLDHVLYAAELLRDQSDIVFVFVGEGADRERLVSLAEYLHLTNVLFLPFQPRSRLPEVLACADISLVILKQGIGKDSLPSKTYSIFASGRPMIASIDMGSEAWNLVQKASAGICVPPEDPGEIANAIVALKENSAYRRKLAENGRKWAELHHSPQAAAEYLEKLFLSISS